VNYFIVAIVLALLAAAGYGVVVYRKNRAERRASPGAPAVEVLPASQTGIVNKPPVVPAFVAKNPFIGLNKEDWTLQHLVSIFVRPGNRIGVGFNEQEIAWLNEAGFDVRTQPTPTGSVDRSGPDLNGGVLRINRARDGEYLSFYFDVPRGGRHVDLTVFTSSGSQFTSVTDYLMCDGIIVKPTAERLVGGSTATHKAFSENLPEGSYSYSVKPHGFVGEYLAAQAVINVKQ
jgi:hypothetical protein